MSTVHDTLVGPDLDVSRVGDLDIDLRDGREPSVTASRHAVADAGPADRTRPLPRPLRRLGRAVVRSLPVAGWLLVFAVIGVLFVPTALGFSRYAIVGGSMSPTFEQGSAVFSQAQPVEALQIGDVITYVPPPDSRIDTLVTHRIVEISETADGERLFRTKGDANADADPWTFTLDAEEQNVVAFSVPHLGRVLIWLADPDVRRLVVGVPAALIGLGAILELLGVAPIGELVRRRRRSGQVGGELVEEGPGGPVGGGAPVAAG